MTEDTSSPAPAHEAHIETDIAARYPYRGVCSCGYRSWGYVARFAAQMMLDDHLKTAATSAA